MDLSDRVLFPNSSTFSESSWTSIGNISDTTFRFPIIKLNESRATIQRIPWITRLASDSVSASNNTPPFLTWIKMLNSGFWRVGNNGNWIDSVAFWMDWMSNNPTRRWVKRDLFLMDGGDRWSSRSHSKCGPIEWSESGMVRINRTCLGRGRGPSCVVAWCHWRSIPSVVMA